MRIIPNGRKTLLKTIYIYGASGHGLVVADIAKSCGYDEILFIDDGENQYPSFEEIKNCTDIPIALGVGVNAVRKKLFEKVNAAGFEIATLVHKNATVSPSVTIGKGTVVMPHVVINANSVIGKGVILNTSCVIEHENIIEDFVHISPNVALGGDVQVGELTHIGIGSSVIQCLKIGSNCIVGAGSVVIHSIKNNTLCYGNPCKAVKELK